MPYDLDLVHISALDVAEYILVLDLRFRRQSVAVLFEIEHEVAGQDRLRGERAAENLLHLRLIDLHRRGGASANLSGRVGLVQYNRLLALDCDRARAAVGIG